MRRFYISFLCIFALAVLHNTVRFHIASVFLAPASIPILLATAVPVPILVSVLIVVVLELLSSMPQGSMLVIFLIPFFTRHVMPWATPDASWKFLSYIASTVCLQVITLVIIMLFTTHAALYAIPFSTALLQIFGTTVSTFVLAIVCFELRGRP